MQVDEDMKKAAGITEIQFVNQFPFEACIVMKHHLAETIQKVKNSISCLCQHFFFYCLIILRDSVFHRSRILKILSCQDSKLVLFIKQAHGSPDWLQPTYNLETDLSELIGDYYVRKRDGRDCLWILKPWNMARTIDTTVTDNLTAIIRLMETGPKICQKYIEHPALFNGKKFDLRYIVLVRSMKPLDLFLSDIFWVMYILFVYKISNAYSKKIF